MEPTKKVQYKAKVTEIYLPKAYLNNNLIDEINTPYIGFIITLDNENQINIVKPSDQYYANIYKDDNITIIKTEYKDFTDDFIKKQIDILYCDKLEPEKREIISKCKQANLFIDYEIEKDDVK